MSTDIPATSRQIRTEIKSSGHLELSLVEAC